MKKKLKIVLKEDVKNVGTFGEIKEVAAGFARNYLIPKGYALYLKDLRSKEILKRREEIQKVKEKERESLKEIAQKLAATVLKFKAKADEKGRLFGSVGPKQIVEKLEKDYKIKLSNKQIEMEVIKSSGEQEVMVKLGQDMDSKLKIIVEPEKPKRHIMNPRETRLRVE